MSQQPRALFLWGGMEFHEPCETSTRFANLLEQRGYVVDVTSDTTRLDDADALRDFDLIVICMTMGEINDQQETNLLSAVKAGSGLAGWHGGLGDTFRGRPNFQYAVGGQWVAHPGDISSYEVKITSDNEITRGIADFRMHSEQYYMHVDPAINVLASTTFSGDHDSWIDRVTMPVAWTKSYGNGRVFYCSLGHVDADFDVPEAAQLVEQGLVWATREYI